MPILYLASSDMMDSSKDLLRKELGAYYFIESPAAGDDPLPELTNKKLVAASQTDLRSASDSAGYSSIMRAVAESVKIESVQTNPALIRPIDSSLYIPNFKIPFRLYGDIAGTAGDEQWRQYIMGGSFGSENFLPLIDTETVYHDHSFQLLLPYEPNKTYLVPSDPDALTATIKSNYLDYDFYVERYQSWATEINSELLIPSYNIIADHLIDQTVDYTDPDLLLKRQLGYSPAYSTVQSYTFPNDDEFESMAKNQYFGEYFPDKTISTDLATDLIRYQQNIIFDHDYYLALSSAGSLEDVLEDIHSLKINQKLSTFYNIQLNFERHKPPAEPELKEYNFSELADGSTSEGSPVDNDIMTAMVDNNFTAKFLELLKDMDEGLIPQAIPQNRNYNYDRVGLGPDATTTTHEAPEGQVSLKSFNYLDFLAYAYNNYNQTLNDNFIFMGPSTPEQAATSVENTLLNTLNSQNVLGVIDKTTDLLTSYTHELMPTGPESPGRHNELSTDILEKLYSPNYKFNEVLAYKIEKLGGAPAGDNSEQNIIQKFWMLNSPEAPDILSLIDSQVKYGKDYTYRVYAYTAVLGHKYKYGDLRLTKQIGTGNLIDDGGETIEYCVQFYDPFTDQTASQQFTTSIGDLTPGNKFGLSTLSTFNEFASDEVDIVQNPQLADFNLYFEPSLKIVEVPIYQKTIKVLDNPPNAINVVPFHFIDQSNRVGFTIGQDSFIERPYPELISTADTVLNLNYYNSRELALTEKIKKFSESPARYIEMYRIKKRPNSFTDFNDSLTATADLRIENNLFNYRDYIISDKIRTNRKYYYLFRLLNENRMPGPVSQIIECELTNDGGYVYSVFDTVDSSEFNPNKFTTNTISFKKLFQIEPHINQMYFDDSNLDYEEYASDQVGNLIVGTAQEKLWDKRFKIRLTSKKTAKKLDLNMGFNYRTKDLSKIKGLISGTGGIVGPGGDGGDGSLS
tara:strand:- start:3414 stop:6311 length:2898 start_codon:yes stop_codon:yes gene_type:complete